MMRKILAVLAIAVCFVPASGALAPANAFGAIAVGQTSNGVAVDGVAIGTSWSSSTQDNANQQALQNCQSNQNQTATPLATKECKVADTFHNQCYAVARDPQPRTPGVGIAIANDLNAAQSQALGNCKTSAGSARAQFCKVTESNCDSRLPQVADALLQFEQNVTWDAVDDSWADGRDQWIAAVNAASTPADLAAQVVALETAMTWDSVDDSWRQRRDGWLSEMQSADSDDAVARGLLELEQATLWSAVTDDWKQLRDAWVAELQPI